MIALLIGAALAHGTVPSGSAAPTASIFARDGQVMASQVATVPSHRDAVVATLPEAAAEVALSEAIRLDLIRNRYPGARYELRHHGPLRVVREASVAVAVVVAVAGCAAARTSISAGAYLSGDDLARARCQREAAGGWLGYDVGARSFFARRPIPAGTYLGRVTARPRPPSATEGAALVYRTSEGPVVVEREVVALQSGRAGRPVFVRTEEGKVLSATLAGAEESE